MSEDLKEKIREKDEQILALCRALREKDNSGRKTCSHTTLRKPYLPCPHPACWPAKMGNTYVHPVLVTTSWNAIDPRLPSIRPLKMEEYERVELQTPDAAFFWAWRQR